MVHRTYVAILPLRGDLNCMAPSFQNLLRFLYILFEFSMFFYLFSLSCSYLIYSSLPIAHYSLFIEFLYVSSSSSFYLAPHIIALSGLAPSSQRVEYILFKSTAFITPNLSNNSPFFDSYYLTCMYGINYKR